MSLCGARAGAATRKTLQDSAPTRANRRARRDKAASRPTRVVDADFARSAAVHAPRSSERHCAAKRTRILQPKARRERRLGDAGGAAGGGAQEFASLGVPGKGPDMAFYRMCLQGFKVRLPPQLLLALQPPSLPCLRSQSR